jgi:hypothetical protein
MPLMYATSAALGIIAGRAIVVSRLGVGRVARGTADIPSGVDCWITLWDMAGYGSRAVRRRRVCAGRPSRA